MGLGTWIHGIGRTLTYHPGDLLHSPGEELRTTEAGHFSKTQSSRARISNFLLTAPNSTLPTLNHDGSVVRPQFDFVQSVGRMPWEFAQVIWLQTSESSGLSYLDMKCHLTIHVLRSRGGVAMQIRVTVPVADTLVQIQTPLSSQFPHLQSEDPFLIQAIGLQKGKPFGKLVVWAARTKELKYEITWCEFCLFFTSVAFSPPPLWCISQGRWNNTVFTPRSLSTFLIGIIFGIRYKVRIQLSYTVFPDMNFKADFIYVSFKLICPHIQLAPGPRAVLSWFFDTVNTRRHLVSHPRVSDHEQHTFVKTASKMGCNPTNISYWPSLLTYWNRGEGEESRIWESRQSLPL